MNRRGFLIGGFAFAGVGAAALADGAASLSTASLKVRFLGTGSAAKDTGPDKLGEKRRFSSVLVDGAVLFDFTAENREMLPKGCHSETVFYTHSHQDHFNAEVAIAFGIKRVYCHESWVDTAEKIFRKTAKGDPVPEVVPLSFGEAVEVNGLSVTSVPANHSTKRDGERCSMYVIDKGATRLLYATDTCGIPRDALKYAGLERNAAKPLTAIIMEATAGVGYENSPELFFSHSSVDTVSRTINALLATKRYCPPEGRKVYLTHLMRKCYARQVNLPAPLTVAHDGLEVEF